MSKSKIFSLPKLGRLALVSDKGGEANGFPGGLGFHTNVSARLIRNGAPVEAKKVWEGADFVYRMLHRHDDPTLIDLGSGLVTNVGAAALSNDWNLAGPSAAPINTLKLANWHATGTGTTAAAATDFKLQTVSGQGGQTPVAGAQSFPTTGTIAVPILKTVATINYTGTEAVTEWGLFTNGTLSTTTGTPFTAVTATTATVTGTPLTASSTTVQGQQQNIVVAGTTTVLALVTSNTTSVLTLLNNGTTGWFTQAAQTAGSTPGNTEAYTFRPIMWDHKVFSAINVVNGDSIQFTYSLTVTSGG